MIGKLTRTIVRTFAFALTLCATTSAWAVAPEPTAVWEAGEFDQTKGGYVISLNGNRIDEKSGNLVIGEYAANNHLGATIDLSGADATSVSILIKYAELPTATTTHINMSSVADSDGKEFGAYITEIGSQRMAIFLKNETSSDYHYSQTSPTMIMASGSGYFLLTYGTTTGTSAYSANNIKALSGNGNGSAKGSSAISAISIGGPVTYIDHHTSGNAWPGAVIEKVALFVGKQCSVDEIQQYCGYTADLASELLPWRYNDNCNIYAWREDYNSTKAYHDAKFSSVGADGSFGTAATVDYTKFGNNRPQPGHVLYYDKSGYQPSSDAKFEPLAIGGLLVRARGKDNANYSIVGTNANKRSTYLGYSGYTTNWKFDEGFIFNRTANTMIFGTANVEIAAGKIFDCNSARTSYETQLGSNARLVLSGEGNMKVSTLNATNGGIDFSALKTRTAESAFITGTLEVGANTKLIFPEGTDLSAGYPVASSVTGTLPGTFEVGDLTYEDTLTTTDGKIYSSSLLFATIDSTEATTFATKFPSATSASDCTLCVFESATMSFGLDTVGTLRIHVEEGKTLTLSGSALTATTIYITGKGTVKATTAGVLKGTLKGDGVLQYNGVLPTITSGISFSNSDWTGTMWLKDYGTLSSGKVNDNLTNDMASWGNSGSKVKFTNVKAYTPNANLTPAYTLVLEDGAGAEEYAWRCDNGFSTSSSVTFGGLAGTGTFYDGGAVTSPFKFNTYNNFTGVFNISAAGHRIGLSANCNGTGGTIAIGPGVTVNFEEGKVWTAGGGFVVNADATLNVNADATVKFTDQGMRGTLNIAEGKTFTAASSDAVSYDTGSSTVNVYGTLDFDTKRWTLGPNTTINLYKDAIVCGTGDSGYNNAALDFNVDGGSTIHAIGNATISSKIRCNGANGTAKIIVDEGKTLTVSGEIFGSYPTVKQGAGTLKITNAASKLPSREAGYIELATGTWNFGSLRDFFGYKLTDGGDAVIKVTQQDYEYGTGRLEICNIDPSIEHVTVIKVDSTETTLNVSAGAASMGDGTAVVGGKACTYDWEFNGDLTSVGYNTTSLSGGSSFDADNQVLYVRSAPYYDSTWTWADAWTVAIKSTIPANGNDIVIAFGTRTGGYVALVTSPNDGKVKLVKGKPAAEDISEMPVSDRHGAEHLYLFSKTVDGRIQVYCDDTLIDNKAESMLGSLIGTLQVGSIHGNRTGTGLNAPGNTDPAAIDFLQVYNYEISDAQRAALISNYAWVNPNQYTRTISGDENLSSSDAWTRSSDSTTVDIPVRDADAIITASSSLAACTVNANFVADTLAINSSADDATLRIKAGTGTLSAAKVAINAPVTVEYGAVDFSSTPVAFGVGGSLTYDFSAEPINSQTERRIVYLTGVAAEPADLSDPSTWPVQVTMHADAANLSEGFLSRFEYDTSSSRYVYTYGPNHTVGGDVYYKGGYWSSDPNNTISVTNSYGESTIVFSGDTVVIPSYYPNATTWSDNTLPANVTKIRVAKSKIKVCSGANSGDIFTGVTWTVDNGCVLWFGVDSKTTSLGEMTINGPGTVECGNITINGTMSGNAPIKILDNVTTRLTSTGSIATDHTISGGSSATITVAKTTPISERMAFGTWTGTVVLPENFNASNGGVDLHYYGKEGSTIEINGFIGWLRTGATYSGAGTYGRQPRPHLKLNGDFSINALSAAWYDIIGGISGSGNFSLSSDNKPNGESFWITKVSGYTGSIINNTTGSAETTLVITELVADTFVGGTKILSRGGTGPLSVNKVTVGETEQSLSDLCYESDGVYVAAAEYNSVKYYSVAAAIAEASDENLADITLLNGCTTVPDGYYIDNEDNNILKKYAAAAVTVGVTTTQWFKTFQEAIDAAVDDNQTTYAVAYADGTATASGTGANVFMLMPNGYDVTVMCSVAGYGAYAQEQEIPGFAGVYLYSAVAAAATFTWTGAAGDNLWATASNWSSEDGTVAAAPANSLYTVELNTAATIAIEGNVNIGTVNVGAAVTLNHVYGVDAKLNASSIVLTAAGASLAKYDDTNSMSLSHIPTTNVSHSRVKTVTVGGTTTYSVEAIPGTIFSVY